MEGDEQLSFDGSPPSHDFSVAADPSVAATINSGTNSFPGHTIDHAAREPNSRKSSEAPS
jgi:hypothetical protein